MALISLPWSCFLTTDRRFCYVYGMATTISIDRDVAERLVVLSRQRGLNLAQVANDILREALPQNFSSAAEVEPLSIGKCLLPNLDNVSEALAFGEGPNFK